MSALEHFAGGRATSDKCQKRKSWLSSCNQWQGTTPSALHESATLIANKGNAKSPGELETGFALRRPLVTQSGRGAARRALTILIQIRRMLAAKDGVVLHLCHPLGLPRMTACPLRQSEHEHDHKDRDNRGGNWTAQVETTVVYGLIEEIANSGAKWSG